MTLARPTSLVRTALALAACLAIPWCVLAAACDDAQSGRGGLFGDNPRPTPPDAEPDSDASDPGDARADVARDSARDTSTPDVSTE